MPRGKYLRADRKPTWTAKTVEALKALDDFATIEQLCQLTGATGNQMRATVHHLKNSRVLDAMVTDGRLWFYLTGDDARTKSVDERVPEEPGTRTRRKYTRRDKLEK